MRDALLQQNHFDREITGAITSTTWQRLASKEHLRLDGSAFDRMRVSRQAYARSRRGAMIFSTNISDSFFPSSWWRRCEKMKGHSNIPAPSIRKLEHRVSRGQPKYSCQGYESDGWSKSARDWAAVIPHKSYSYFTFARKPKEKAIFLALD